MFLRNLGAGRKYPEEIIAWYEEKTQLVNAVRKLETALQYPVEKSDNSNFAELKNIFEKSLAMNKELKVGHVLGFEDLEAKKPKGFGIDALRFEEVIGMELKKDMKQWNFLNELDFQLGDRYIRSH